MAKLYNYLKEKKMMSSTMVGFGVDESKLKRTIDYIESWLVRYKVPYEIVEKNHISIAQITSKVKKDELVRLVNKISNEPFQFYIKRISILQGREWDFIALELNRSEKYLKLFQKIKEEHDVVEFAGGMKPHISLIRVVQGVATEDFMADIVRNIPLPKKIKAKKVEIWNNKFQIDYSKRKRI